jgi:hypothetical protein
MNVSSPSRRLVFVEAEKVATDAYHEADGTPEFLRLPALQGVLTSQAVSEKIEALRALDVDEYIRNSVWPSEHPKRKSAPEVIRQLGGTIIHEVQDGPLYLAEISFTSNGRMRRILVLAQNRKSKNGVWMPRHHDRAADLVRQYSSFGMPVVTFIDTPGADAGEEANLNNQAHSISHLIMEMANLQLPSVAVVFGNGYSGGAIPLATTNVLLSVRDGVFNTIHPQGLSEIAYNYNLSWQECAKYIGVSSYELFRLGYLDGIIDYSPLESASPRPLVDAIFSALDQVERNAQDFLREADNHFFFTHYQESILRFLHPAESLVEENRIADKTPTGMLNVFGSVYRFHRYLKLRTRLSNQSILRYSRLDAFEPPEGELLDRLEREREERFHKWIGRPLEIRYDEALTRRYKRLLDTERSLGQDRNRFTSFFIGTPQRNHEQDQAVDPPGREGGDPFPHPRKSESVGRAEPPGNAQAISARGEKSGVVRSHLRKADRESAPHRHRAQRHQPDHAAVHGGPAGEGLSGGDHHLPEHFFR